MTIATHDEFDELFAPEVEMPHPQTQTGAAAWKILLVDDDDDIHAVLRLALQDMSAMGRSLQLLDAYSAEEAKALLTAHPDIALILLDVVMESQHAGLALVGHVRLHMGVIVRIVVLTGQPGYAPPRTVVADYEIDGYLPKGELTMDRIFVSVYAALRTHQALLNLSRKRVQLKAARTTLEHERVLKAAIVDSSDDAIIALSPDGLITNWNRSAERILGYRAEEMQGRSALVLAPIENRGAEQKLIDLVRQGESIRQHETERVRKDGSRVPVSLTASPIHKITGDVIGVSIITRDITARKMAEMALRESHETLQNICETTLDGFWQIDREGRILEVNEAYCRLSGYVRHELLGLRISDLEAKESQEQIFEHIRRTMARGGDQFETLHRRKDGSVWPVEISTSFTEMGGGRFFVFVRDIEARKLTEKALRNSHVTLLSIQDTTQDGYWKTDREGRIVDVNASYCRYSGYTRQELLQMKIADLEVGESGAAILERIQRIAAKGSDQFESLHRRKDGSFWPVEISVSYTELGGGFCLAFVRDITARKKAESELRVAAITFEAQEGIVITDAMGVILRVNRAFEEITGYSLDDVRGKTPAVLKSNRHSPAFYEVMWSALLNVGSWSGEIWNRRKDGSVYPEFLSITAVKGAGDVVTHYVGTFTDISESKAAAEKIEHLAFYDLLTELPNRRLMLDRLGFALANSARRGRHGALMLIDLDNFKTLNDSLGHDVGDQLLVEAAVRLKIAVREGDTVSRLGGDEFVVILEDLDETQLAATQAENVALKILSRLCEPYWLNVGSGRGMPGQRSHHCTSSIGIALFRDGATNADELLKRADTAMYQAKAAGRNTLRFFDPIMQATVIARAALEADLRQAVEQGQFLLHYQAQVDSSDRVIGAEALVRWSHPERGLVSPAEFIPLAESTGLILPLGAWVLETACIQLAHWATQAETAHLSLAVNVSARQFAQPDIVEQVLAVVSRTGAPPERLKLELTESLLLDNTEDVIAKMRALKARGVGFSLDDFGTGYSSLSYLRRLPLDQLKIDQSFVRDVLGDHNGAAIARTVVALGQSLGLSVIAEGVETGAHRDFLASIGCETYQGYFFSRPIGIDAFEAFLQASLATLS